MSYSSHADFFSKDLSSSNSREKPYKNCPKTKRNQVIRRVIRLNELLYAELSKNAVFFEGN